ncbi:hypothetical protein GGF46_003739 [Coemansia sp. RSA 552]|nr:hypothetical protein GGF46_003739 [Coemansia sp. RSA 552]
MLTAVWKVPVVLAVFGGMFPALIGLVLDVYFLPLFTYSPNGQLPQYETDTTMVQVVVKAWVRYAFGVAVAAGLVFGVVERLGQVHAHLMQGPWRWRMRWLLVDCAAPVMMPLAVLLCIPFFVAMLFMAYSSALTADSFWNLVLLKDTMALALYVRVSMLVIVGVFVLKEAVALYWRCDRVVRDRLYIVDRVLENVDGTDSATIAMFPPPTDSCRRVESITE